jgi:hypothetical protein
VVARVRFLLADQRQQRQEYAERDREGGRFET